MINAKIQVELPQNAGLLIEFSDANGKFKDSPQFFTTVQNRADLLRRLYFKNRAHICDTLQSFLNQRLHALPHYPTKIKNLQNVVSVGRNYTYPALCELIASNATVIEQIAPLENTRYYNHYQNSIIPILTECKNIQSGKAKVHYC